MKIIKNSENFNRIGSTILSLGVFDGVHKGHKYLIDKLNNIAKQRGMSSVIFTFCMHPKKVLQPDFDLKMLTTLEEKLVLLELYGVDEVIVQDFKESFRDLSAEDFVEKILVKNFGVKYLIVGHDHRFGKEGKGNYALLEKLSSKFGFELEQIEVVKEKNSIVSSTSIRNLLKSGNIIGANEMLGYPYTFSGTVIGGNRIGRKLGFPTANIFVDSGKLLPKNAVYVVKVYIGEMIFRGMLNIGMRPTVGGNEFRVEVFILDFDEDIYGKQMRIELLDFLREEQKFSNLDELKNQLEKDKQYLKSINF